MYRSELIQLIFG